MNKVKIKGIGWIDLDSKTDGFYFGLEKIIGCDGKILDSRVLDYIIFD